MSRVVLNTKACYCGGWADGGIVGGEGVVVMVTGGPGLELFDTDRSDSWLATATAKNLAICCA